MTSIPKLENKRGKEKKKEHMYMCIHDEESYVKNYIWAQEVGIIIIVRSQNQECNWSNLRKFSKFILSYFDFKFRRRYREPISVPKI